ncbi:MAG TPA: hypothetical protein VGL71_09230 [Urbifossiella sp.]
MPQSKLEEREFTTHYNTVRLHSGIGYITPQDKLHGKDQAIFDARDRSRDVKFVRFCGRCKGCVDFGGGRSDATA